MEIAKWRYLILNKTFKKPIKSHKYGSSQGLDGI